MAEIVLLQADAGALLRMEKIRADEQERLFPDLGGQLRYH